MDDSAGAGIGLDYAGLDDTGLRDRESLTEPEIECYQRNRIQLILRAHGINPASLSIIERRQIEMGLAFDDDPFPDNEYPIALRRFYQTAGIADALVLSADEIADAKNTIATLPEHEREELEAVKLNLQSAIQTLGSMQEAGASLTEIAAELSAFLLATPDQGHIDPGYHLVRPLFPAAGSSDLARGEMAGLSPLLLGAVMEVTDSLNTTYSSSTSIGALGPESILAELGLDPNELNNNPALDNGPAGLLTRRKSPALA